MTAALESALQEVSEALYEKMEMLLPEVDGSGESRLLEAMRYSALAPGKRLRPFLTVMTANLFGVSRDSALQTAAAIEFVHTYSLIHDDLPAMDNDDVRRGQPSCHIQFDEATAILAGDGLLTYAFEVLADRSTHSSHAVRCELIRALAKASGPRGMVGGQMMDLAASNDETIAINRIIRLQRLKTGELFAISCEAGAILGNASSNLRNLLRGYAHDIGLAFQITDDLLDAEAVIAPEGAIERMDKSSEKATFVSAMGIEKSKEQSAVLADQAKKHLHTFGKKADILCDLAEYIVDREH
jgi:farnesyl diphosphate synthase